MNPKSENVKLDDKSAYASNLNRFAAYLVDILIIAILAGVFGTLLGTTAASLLGFVVMVIYYSYFHSKDGQTLGMKLVGIKITKEDGTLIDGLNAVLRTIAYWFLSAITIGISSLIAVFTAKKQTLHDIIFHTIYVNEDTEKNSRGKFVVGCTCGLGCLIPLIFGILLTIGVLSTKDLPGRNFIPSQMPMNTGMNIPETSKSETKAPEKDMFTESQDNMMDTKYQDSINFLNQLTFNIKTYNLAKNNCLNSSLSRIYKGPITDIESYCVCESKISTRNGLNKVGFRDSDITKEQAVIQYCSVYTTQLAPLKYMPKDIIYTGYTHEDVKKYLSTLKYNSNVANGSYNTCLAGANIRVTD